MEVKKTFSINNKEYDYYSLMALENRINKNIQKFPYSMKILLENLLRHADGKTVTEEDIMACASWSKDHAGEKDIAFYPSRIVMQDLTGVPAVVDLAAMRDAIILLGRDARTINPVIPVDLVVDHSVMVDFSGTSSSFDQNVKKEYERNRERYRFLKWGQNTFDNFRVVPPGMGIVHQVNLEYFGRVVWEKEENGRTIAFPDTLVGTDSHTPMINSLGILGWGVGGIEAEAALLGQGITMLIPEVIGFEFTGRLQQGVTATDLVLTVTEMLRKKGVVGKFVEYYGPGLDTLTLEDRATVSNMSPEYGATCGIFPVDEEVLSYLRCTGRSGESIQLIEAYAKEQGLFRDSSWNPEFTDTLHLDLGDVEPCIAGPGKPHNKVFLKHADSEFGKALDDLYKVPDTAAGVKAPGADYSISHGDVVIAAITSCTNTSNPAILICAGLLAKNAREKGLTARPWVKTSFAPGSRVVTEYLDKAGLTPYLDELGFNLAGYGCTTCIGNSGPLPEPVKQAIVDGGLITCNVLSGNRNFEGRINPDSVASYLASPPLVVAYAIAGSMNVNLMNHPLGKDAEGKDVFLKDIWPDNDEIKRVMRNSVTPEMFRENYKNVFTGTGEWRELSISGSDVYDWQETSTYIQSPPFFKGLTQEPGVLTDITGARCLAVFPDFITTDHISPAGAIPQDNPAGSYLISRGVDPLMFNSFGSRRGNHEVMMRGTFGNIRIKNRMVPGVEGGFTKSRQGETVPVYTAAMDYIKEDIPLVVFAGKEYGTGSSRDWAAKGTLLLGVKAVIAKSFERIHRSNLIGMGVLPLEFKDPDSVDRLSITGSETYDLVGISSLEPKGSVTLIIHSQGADVEVDVLVRIDTPMEYEYYRHGGILQYVLRQLSEKTG